MAFDAKTRLITLPRLYSPDRPTMRLTPGQVESVRAMNQRIRASDIPFETVACICGGTDFQQIAGTDRYGLLQPTAICTSCGLVQSHPRMTDDAYRHFYESDEYRRIYEGEPFPQKCETNYTDSRGKALFSKLARYREASSIGSVLEVGAGGGWNLVPFIEAGIPVAGYDYSPELVALGANKGINLIRGGIEDIEGTFDLVLLIHVLEHFTDVPASLSKIREHMNPGGLLWVEVPDIEVFDGGQIQNAHAYYFSQRTLEFSASQGGFRMVHHARDPAVGHMAAGFVASNSPPLTREFLAGHYDDMAVRLRHYERTYRLRSPVRAAGRLLDAFGLAKPFKAALRRIHLVGG
jgi:SAM-dependent methyltransferase